MKGREGASVMERCLYEGKGRCQCDGKVSVWREGKVPV